MSAGEERVEFESAEFGPAWIAATDLLLLAEFAGLTRDECVRRLSTYSLEEMAAAWRERDPRTPAEIRDFYAGTDLYLWELLAWNGSVEYGEYLHRLDQLAELWPPVQHPRALDFGCGVGTAALYLAELGYQVTLAEIRGLTLDFARARLLQHGHVVEVIEISDDRLELPRATWNVLVCYDVLEHVPDPADLVKQLIKALERGGGAAIAAAFDWEDPRFPHHLPGPRERFAMRRWDLYLQGLGMKSLGDLCYQRSGVMEEVLRRLRYLFWRMTGLHVERPPR